MISHDFEDRLITIIVILLVLFAFAAVPYLAYREGAVSRQCLAKGYPNTRTTLWTFGQSYCVKRVDQTDVVVKLEDAK